MDSNFVLNLRERYRSLSHWSLPRYYDAMNICMRIWSGLVSALTVMSLWCVDLRADADPVAQAYRQALELFEKNQDKQAAALLKKIIERNPGYNAAYYLLGRVQYRENQITKAARSFLQAGTGLITANGAFEFGVSMFTISRYNEALIALRKVPKKSPNRNLALFYMGVSSYRLGNNSSAEHYLRRAKKLPDEFIDYRARVLQAIRSRSSGTYNPYSYQGGGYSPYAPDASRSAGAREAGKKEEEKPKEPPRGFFVDLTPQVSYSFEQSKADKHGTGFDEKGKRGVKSEIDLSLRQQNSSRAAILSMGLDTVALYQLFSSSGRAAMFFNDGATIYSYQESIDNSSSDDQFYRLGLQPYANFRIGGGTALMTRVGVYRDQDLRGSKISYVVPFLTLSLNSDFDESDLNISTDVRRLSVSDGSSRSNIDFYGGYDYDFENFTAGTKAGYAMSSGESSYGFYDGQGLENPAVGSFASRITASLYASKNWETSSLKSTLSFKQLAAPNGQVLTGDYDEYKIANELVFQLSFGISVTGNFSYAMVPYSIKSVFSDPNEVVSGKPRGERTTENVPVSYDRMAYGAKISVAPIDGVSADLKMDQLKDTVSSLKKDKQKFVEQSVADSTLKSSFQIALSMNF
jgi:tetratricopeptide (TPR) repeat protein